MTPEQIYERSERLRKAKVAARDAAEAAENAEHIRQLLARQNAEIESAAHAVFARREPCAGGYWTHEQVIAERTGKEVDGDGWLTARARNETLRRQTKRLAEALERQGISAYRNGPVTSLVGLVTGEAVELTSYRSIRFLPLVAQRERREFVNQFMHLAETDKKVGAYGRYIVVTNPTPVPVFGDLGDTLSDHFAEVVKLGEMLSSEFGIELLLRATEMPIAERPCDIPVTHTDVDEETGEVDQYTELVRKIVRAAHVHSNLAVVPTRYLGPDGWSKVLKRIHEMFPHRQITDCGKIKDVRELVKYSVKPTDLDDASDEEIAWLYEQTKRRHIVQPFNRFKAFRAELKEKRLKVISNPEKEDGSAKRTVIPVLKELRTNTREGDGRKDKERTDVCAYLLGTTTPQPLFTPFLEPCVLVQNYGLDMDIEARTRLSLLQTAARRVWDEAGAPPPEAALRLAAGLSAGIEGRIVSLKREAKKRADGGAGNQRIFSTHTGYRPEEYDPGGGDLEPPIPLRRAS